MDNSFHPQRSDTRPPGAFFTALLKVLDSALHWLAGLIQLTEEEQEDAGIFPDGIHDQ
jgi:hypothetical protein